MYKILFSILWILHSLFCFAQIPTLEKHQYKKVELLRSNYDYPTIPFENTGSKTKQIWVVYSDKDDNAIYSEKDCIKITSHVSFLDSFFVISVAGDMFELVRYDPLLISLTGKIVSPDNIKYVGWINKSNLLLNERSFVDKKTLFAYKYVTILNGTNLFPNTISNLKYNQIDVFKTPELKSKDVIESIKFNDVVFAYKFQKDKILIGKSSQFSTKNAAQQILGWVSISYIKNWGTRLNLEVNKPESMDTLYSYLYPAKNLAINYESNIQTAIPLQSNTCALSNPFWNKHPIYGMEIININNKEFNTIETGTHTNPFDNSNAYIYSVSGSKIDYNSLCNHSENTKTTNILFALNLDDDIKEYYTDLIENFQELDRYFSKAKLGNFSFSFVNTADNTYKTILTKNNYYELLPIIIDAIKENVQFKKTASAYGILNGLTTATNYFSNHVDENNILFMISAQGDYAANDNIYKSKFDRIAIDIASSHSRIIMYQPYASQGLGYSNFIPQSKSILKRYADKSIAISKNTWVTQNENTAQNSFISLESGATNIYCLDYPENANTQGFISFPTVGSKIDRNNASKTIDLLLKQITIENTNQQEQLLKTFNSSSIFNTKHNLVFEKFYNMYSALPRNLELETKNVNFDYFVTGFAIEPYDPHSTKRHYQQYLLLNQEEYAELANIFKSLKIDQLLENPTEINKKHTQDRINDIYKNRLSISKNTYKNPSLKVFFYELAGYNTNKTGLGDFSVKNVFNNSLLSKDKTYEMIRQLKKSFEEFYEIKDNPNTYFESNGKRYYWVNENNLP